MNLKKLILTKNACYKSGVTIPVKGIMVHSTGANNPKLSRYIGPDDGILGANANNNHWNQDKPGGREVCVHAFIGKIADGSIATYQTLPWNWRGWHGGGTSNNSYIGFEICEDDLSDASYFSKVYKEAVELCAYLCKEYKLNPLGDGVIIGHYEGYARGIASNHGDPKNWFSKFGKSMDTFRSDVNMLVTAVSIPAGHVRMDYKGKALTLKADNKKGSYRANIEDMADLFPALTVGVRDIFEQNGSTVTWDNSTDTIVVR